MPRHHAAPRVRTAARAPAPASRTTALRSARVPGRQPGPETRWAAPRPVRCCAIPPGQSRAPTPTATQPPVTAVPRSLCVRAPSRAPALAARPPRPAPKGRGHRRPRPGAGRRRTWRHVPRDGRVRRRRALPTAWQTATPGADTRHVRHAAPLHVGASSRPLRARPPDRTHSPDRLPSASRRWRSARCTCPFTWPSVMPRRAAISPTVYPQT